MGVVEEPTPRYTCEEKLDVLQHSYLLPQPFEGQPQVRQEYESLGAVRFWGGSTVGWVTGVSLGV